ncbi:hypothetical protein EB796_013216 [Bugula neritina]|uniref:Uncharacterized protein n=1 Tax=Bugula neritina TaxID=10212 RepID=A0A7J7JQ50_BUGNE|nr:hypothetical protein EB796_013216 [Bugula neritina]
MNSLHFRTRDDEGMEPPNDASNSTFWEDCWLKRGLHANTFHRVQCEFPPLIRLVRQFSIFAESGGVNVKDVSIFGYGMWCATTLYNSNL